MSVKEEDGSEGESKIKKGGRTPYDIQRSKLDKLMKDPSKPVFIPEMRKEKDPNKAPDFVYNVMGSSAGAGSGEFHIYRAIRRKETLRQEKMAEPPRQPRQPKDLPGLLKFCMEATATEDAPAPSSVEAMDPERRKWLEEALKNMTVDIVKELTECIKALNDPCVKDPDSSEESLSRVIAALDCVSDFVDNIDMANNFHKLGGFQMLKNCLRSPHEILRQNSANVTAELAQNNPYCQTNLLKDDFLPVLLEIFDNDASEDSRFKALSAISCLVRDNLDGQQSFLQLNGCSVLLRNIQQTSQTRLRVKACFFMSAVCEENPTFKEAFLSMGMVHQLVFLLQHDHEQSHEHMARALLTLISGNQSVVDEVRDIKDFKEFVQTRLELLEGQEEFDEEKSYFQSIQEICFAGQSPKSPATDQPDR